MESQEKVGKEKKRKEGRKENVRKEKERKGKVKKRNLERGDGDKEIKTMERTGRDEIEWKDN